MTTIDQPALFATREDDLADLRAVIAVRTAEVQRLYRTNKAAWSLALGLLCDDRRREELLVKLVKIEQTDPHTGRRSSAR